MFFICSNHHLNYVAGQIARGNRTQEEFHYAYDQQGRLYEATFAQTPSNLTPDSSGYYDGYEAQTRARAHYEYDGAGRLTWLGHLM